MTSLILIWKEDDKSDIRIVRDENGRPLLFERKSWAQEFAFRNYSLGSGKPTKDLYNYEVVEL